MGSIKPKSVVDTSKLAGSLAGSVIISYGFVAALLSTRISRTIAAPWRSHLCGPGNFPGRCSSGSQCIPSFIGRSYAKPFPLLGRSRGGGFNQDEIDS
jgi:hypothetical protein